MCLAIPGKIKSIDENSDFANVDFNGITRSVNISLVKVKKGDHVIVHAGFAIQKLSEQDVTEILSIINGKTKL